MVRVVESQENAVDIQWIVFFVLKLYNLKVGWLEEVEMFPWQF